VSYEGKGATFQRGGVTALEAVNHVLGLAAAARSGGGKT
jgi:hypothetical protein